MTSRGTGNRALFIAAFALATLGGAQPATAQFDIGVGFNVADTETNAVGLGGTVTWLPTGLFSLRGFVDAELGIPDLKEGLEYDESSDRVYIVDQSGDRQNPRGDELWQGQGWHVHGSLYGTINIWRLSTGPGVAYNGHDGSASSGFAWVVIGHVTRRSEIDVELLKGGSWRLRVSVAFWRFP